MRTMISGLTGIALLAVVQVHAQDTEASSEPELWKRLQALRVPDVAWRQIPWKTCLLDGLLEAQRKKKPLMFWCQIDRPIDDTRC